jgi:nucleotide-binding universal stress UspA family protein
MPARHQKPLSDLGVTRAGGLPIDPVEEIYDYGAMYRAAEIIGQRLADGGTRVAREAGASKVNSIAREGDPAAVILDVAREEKIDLIVLGSRGLGTLQGLLVGSVSSKVNRLSDCCCITVK